MAVDPSWLTRGYFDLSGQDSRSTTTLQIRNELCKALGLPPGGLTIKSWPLGPAWRDTFWWREGVADYVEAQYFIHIARDYPILSLGISVEKGFESGGSRNPDEQMLDRSRWDWQRLVSSAEAAVAVDIPAISHRVQRPVTLRFCVHDHSLVSTPDSRAFTFVDGSWFERHRGRADPAAICDHIARLDTLRDQWVDTFAAFDLCPAEVAGLTPSDLAQLLLAFEPLRRRLRGAT